MHHLQINHLGVWQPVPYQKIEAQEVSSSKLVNFAKKKKTLLCAAGRGHWPG